MLNRCPTTPAIPFLLIFAVAISCGQQACAQSKATDDKLVTPLFATHCYGCHDQDVQEGDFNLKSLLDRNEANWDVTSLDQLAGVYQKLMSAEMPPPDEPQVARKDKIKMTLWLRGKLKAHGHSSEWDKKLLYPEYGNFVEHSLLFDGSVIEKPWSPSRLWKKSPYLFDSVLYRGIGFRPGRYGQPPSKLSKIKQPFNLEEKSGILDFAAVRFADSATLATLMRNAEVLVDQHLQGAMQELHVKTHGPLPKDQWPKDRKGNPVQPKFAKTVDEFRNIILADGKPTDDQLNAAIRRMFDLLIEQSPSTEDLLKYRALCRSCIDQAGNAEGLRMMLIAVSISPRAIYRSELGAGPMDENGRQILAPIELAYAIAYALTDNKPDEQLLKAATEGKLGTREEVRKQVIRIWDDEGIDKPRILRFFQEFFGYHYAPKVFKDAARFKGDYRQVPQHLVNDCDTLVKYIVDQDRQVLRELLTTEKYFVAHSGDNNAIAKTVDSLDQFHEYLKDKDWKNFPYQTPKEHKQKIVSIDRMFTHANGNVVRRWMTYLTLCDKNGLTPIPMMNNRDFIQLYNLDEKSFSFPVQQPFSLDPQNRIGILMHPAWLIAHSLNLDNDPVRRGKWIRERLLADTVPDLPITVDARIPESPEHSLRERFEVTRQAECWRCHVKMNPLGMPFESFDDFGKYRITEKLHGSQKTKPVDRSGRLAGTQNKVLDGDVKSPVDLMKRLADSDRVRQSFVRHAFRFWMGRNEMISDSQTLIDADQAYVDHDGSFRAIVVSLLTSDSFLYRKEVSGDPPNYLFKTKEK